MERMCVCNEELRLIHLFTSNKNQNGHKITAGETRQNIFKMLLKTSRMSGECKEMCPLKYIKGERNGPQLLHRKRRKFIKVSHKN